MEALRLVGLILLAGITLSVFFVVYDEVQGISSSERAKNSLDDIHSAISYVITTGNLEKIDFEVPGGYKASFENKKVHMKKLRRPENGFSRPVDGPELSPGEYQISIRLENEIVHIEVEK